MAARRAMSVCRHPHQGRLAMGQAPEHAVEQDEALVVAVTGDAFGQFEEGAGHGRCRAVEAGRRVRDGAGRERRRQLAGHARFGQNPKGAGGGRRRARGARGHAESSIGSG
jgi:hypothetical protein